MLRPFLLLAAFFGFTGVALGAFAAHGLKKQLSAEYLAVFQTGVHYQLIHALALFGVALLATRLDGRLVSAAGGLFTLGILLFSGSLYLLTLVASASSASSPRSAASPSSPAGCAWGWPPGAWATPETGCLRRRTCRQGALVIGVDRARMPLPFTFVTVQPCRFN